jgi:hypothetical protein
MIFVYERHFPTSYICMYHIHPGCFHCHQHILPTKKLRLCKVAQLLTNVFYWNESVAHFGAGGEVQVVERLPSKCEVLTSNPSAITRKKSVVYFKCLHLKIKMCIQKGNMEQRHHIQNDQSLCMTNIWWRHTCLGLHEVSTCMWAYV